MALGAPGRDIGLLPVRHLRLNRHPPGRRLRHLGHAVEPGIQGRDFLVGDSLSAADLYWTAFSNLMAPMADDLVEVPDYYKAFGVPCMAAVEVPMAALFEHRDRIARDYFDTPLRF